MAEGALFREPDAGRLEGQQRELTAGRDVLGVHVLGRRRRRVAAPAARSDAREEGQTE